MRPHCLWHASIGVVRKVAAEHCPNATHMKRNGLKRQRKINMYGTPDFLKTTKLLQVSWADGNLAAHALT